MYIISIYIYIYIYKSRIILHLDLMTVLDYKRSMYHIPWMKKRNYGEIAVQSVSPIKALQQLNQKYEGVTRIVS